MRATEKVGSRKDAPRFAALVPWTAAAAEGAADWLPRVVGQRWRESSGLPTDTLIDIARELELPPRQDWTSVERAAAAQQVDAVLVRLARGRGAIDIGIGEALAELSDGDGTLRLGFSGIGDYGQERLGLAARTAQGLARLGRELAERPVLRAAVRSGRLSARKAQAVLPVAIGDEEAAWTERAKGETVRALEAAVRCELRDEQGTVAAAGASCERYRSLTFEMSSDELRLLDHALEVARRVSGPNSSRAEQVAALCQEFLSTHPSDREERFHDVERRPGRSERVRAALEQIHHQWQVLGPVEAAPAPAEADRTAESVDPFALDRRLRQLLRLRQKWDELVGKVALVLTALGLWRELGFASLGHYAAERLGLAARTLQERARLAKRLASLPGLREAMRSGRLSYEQVKLVAQVASGRTEGAWIARAEGLTVLALRRLVTEWEDEGGGQLVAPLQRCQRVFRMGPPNGRLVATARSDDSLCRRGAGSRERITTTELAAGRKMCAPAGAVGRKMCAPSWRSPLPWRRQRRLRLPESTATLLWVAIESARSRFGPWLSKATALAVIAAHFVSVWEPTLPRPRTVSERVLARDGGRCQVPGCSRAAVHAHHVEYRSQGGSDDEDNLVGLCAAHHLRGVHQGWVMVTGKAPKALVWRLGVHSCGALLEYRSGPDGPVRV